MLFYRPLWGSRKTRNGAFERIRTADPHLTMVVLYLLSYKGILLRGGE